MGWATSKSYLALPFSVLKVNHQLPPHALQGVHEARQILFRFLLVSLHRLYLNSANARV
jgi:hypothetical protein